MTDQSTDDRTWALVTGASKGIGAATAVALARQGRNVLVGFGGDGVHGRVVERPVVGLQQPRPTLGAGLIEGFSSRNRCRESVTGHCSTFGGVVLRALGAGQDRRLGTCRAQQVLEVVVGRRGAGGQVRFRASELLSLSGCL